MQLYIPTTSSCPQGYNPQLDHLLYPILRDNTAHDPDWFATQRTDPRGTFITQQHVVINMIFFTKTGI